MKFKTQGTVLAATLAAILMAGSFGASNTAYAADTAAMDKAELAQLTPQLRSDVESRLVDGQTVHGVLETMLLNKVSQQFASGKIVATDFDRGDVVVQGPNGGYRVFPFDVATLQLRAG